MVACVVKFEVGDGPRRAANRLSVHPANDADESFGLRKEAQDVVSLIGKLRTIDLDETDVVGAGFKAESPEPISVKTRRSRLVGRRFNSLPKPFNGRMFRKRCHYLPLYVVYATKLTKKKNRSAAEDFKSRPSARSAIWP